MEKCDKCYRYVPHRYEVTVYDEKEDLRAYAVVDEFYAYFTGEVTIHVCVGCFAVITGKLPTDMQPPKNLFHIRTLQSGFAVEVAKALFEHCGYRVRHNGYEYLMPEWMATLKSGDANRAAAQIKCKPDLIVYDDHLNDVYEIEVKTTARPSSNWRCRKDAIDTLRYYHPDALLMVYVQQEHQFYVQRLRIIDWGNIAAYDYGRQTYYEVNLQSVLLKPTELFDRVTPDDYFPFLQEVRTTLTAFS